MAKKEKAKKPIYKKWWAWVLAIIVISAFASGGEETDTSTAEQANTSEEATAKPDEQPTAKIGEPLKVGDVVFTAHEKTSAPNIGPEGLGQTAQGTYLIVDVTAKNEGQEPITTDSSYFQLKAGGATYEADAAADIYVNEAGGGFFFQSINPGIENKGKIVFDVPADVIESGDLTLNVQTGIFGTEQGQIKLAK